VVINESDGRVFEEPLKLVFFKKIGAGVGVFLKGFAKDAGFGTGFYKDTVFATKIVAYGVVRNKGRCGKDEHGRDFNMRGRGCQEGRESEGRGDFMARMA
jgi:hypothetical protein